jgi:hypothetical protein
MNKKGFRKSYPKIFLEADPEATNSLKTADVSAKTTI